ncbi:MULTISPECIES: Mrp/NBP35 family ATP-binding protein [unclassified Rothia (in: high G+C Gram-positive bacteria)]|uniref:Mrp/NBP35 family ATP-binding protein n=1 Tax=unclassified Rothia (in: high G+C Gram-positive bacteria) TaxID=2689056 RepID=UPI001959039E|nr:MULTISPECIES: Mrp/NBP35 family ATP-binding protein [unclassified Rothia (in: high G+C Gram-positive bacteria)]MBM7051096.1 Mrp/NBP35 family ATP-binding protein [Rothia sp. ZJ1223]QRZ62202.1 Mrp/NBP35 family ATP-binding protein [Rothia sp. ZJ932]
MEQIDVALLEALGRVDDPELRRPITELGMVESARLVDGVAMVSVLLTIEGCPLRSTIEADVKAAVSTVEGVREVIVEVGYMTPDQRTVLREKLGHSARVNPFASPDSLTKVYAVVSGKGGVGKSSVTVNLAAAFASQGLKVGVVDADVHGFSVPGLLGITQAPTRLEEMIVPPVVSLPDEELAAWQRQHSAVEPGFIKVISIGMFVDSVQPVAWRGPMLHRALEQFLTDVYFGDLDVLLLDLPPGTGDIAISMAQLLPTAELVLVSTPQLAAVDVAQRAGTLSLQTEQKVVGIVENMSAMVMPDGSAVEVFGSGGGQVLSERLGEVLGYEVPELGSVPLDVSLRAGGDAGRPVVWSAPDSPAGSALRAVAQTLGHAKRNLAGRKLPLNF